MNMTEFAQYPTGNLCNAHPQVKSIGAAIKPLIPAKRVAGRARTARIAPGQNAAIHRAVHGAEPEDMLVVDGGGIMRFGPFGDLLAECCKARGLAGGVFDCMIRDSTEIAALDFQIFSRGFHPEATAKNDPGEIDIPVSVGGVTVTPGDIVVGDDDGIVVFAAAIAQDVYERVNEVAAREERVRNRVLAGETTFEIFGLSA